MSTFLVYGLRPHFVSLYPFAIGWCLRGSSTIIACSTHITTLCQKLRTLVRIRSIHRVHMLVMIVMDHTLAIAQRVILMVLRLYNTVGFDGALAWLLLCVLGQIYIL